MSDENEFNMTPLTSGIQNTASTALSEIDKEYEVIAQQKIRDMVDGNGVKGEDVKFLQFEGATLQFLATTKLQFRFKTLERIEAGRKTGLTVVSGLAQVKEEITKQEQKITHRGDIIKRIQTHIVEGRKDMGYGLNGEMIKLPFLYIEYVFHQACNTCKAKGQVMCQRCNGLGYEKCTQCHGQGLEVCIQCHGDMFIQGNNGRQQCPKCHGRGKSSCRLCHERMKIQCRVCKTKGSTTCTVCNGHAWNSHIYKLEIDAMPSFEYDRENVRQRIGDIIDAMGSKLIDHAKIKAIFKTENEKDYEDKRDYIAIPYIVHLPYAEIRYSIGDQVYNTLLFGNKCELKHVPFILDKLLKTPIARLKEAAENRGNVADKIKNCCDYKIIKQAVLASARMPLNKAAKKLKFDNPHGLQNNTIKSLVVYADQAIKNITRRPRKIGMIGGIISLSILYGLYFMAGLRGLIVGEISNTLAHLIPDILILGAGMGLGIGIIKFVSRRALLEALKGIIPADKQKGFLPKTGKSGANIITAAPFIFLIVIESAIHIFPDIPPPEWYNHIREIVINSIQG